MSNLGARIKQKREQKGLSQAALAQALNVSQQAIQQVESGKASKPRYLYELANLLETSYEWLLTGQDNAQYQQVFSPVATGAHNVQQPEVTEASAQIKILELVPGGGLGCHSYTGKVSDMAMRPRSLDNAPKAYGLYVYDNRMAPRYHFGEIVYAHPGVPVSNGDYVVVHIKNKIRHDYADILITRLQQKGVNTYVFFTMNPQEALKVEASQVLKVDKIVASSQ